MGDRQNARKTTPTWLIQHSYNDGEIEYDADDRDNSSFIGFVFAVLGGLRHLAGFVPAQPGSRADTGRTSIRATQRAR